MVRHVIIWKLKEDLDADEIQNISRKIKEGLEGLQGKIPGLAEIKVIISPLESSNGDVMLDSLFEDEASLKGYSIHPEHVAVANEKVRPYTKVRMCMDYVVDSESTL